MEATVRVSPLTATQTTPPAARRAPHTTGRGPAVAQFRPNFVRKPLSDGSDFRHCEDEDEDSEDPRDEARSPYIRERPGKNQTKNTEQNSARSSSPSLAPP